MACAKSKEEKNVDDSPEKEPDSDTSSDQFEDAVDRSPTCLGNAPHIKWYPLRSVNARTFGTYSSNPNSLCNDAASAYHMVRRLRLQYKLDSVHTGCVNAINFSPCGSLLASGSDDLKIVVWKWMEQRPLASFDSKHTSNVFQSRFMPESNNSLLVSAARDGQVRAHMIQPSGELASSRRIAYHKDSAHKLAVDPSLPNNLLSCGEDGLVCDIDLRTSSPTRLLHVKRDSEDRDRKVPLYSVFMNPVKTCEFAVGGRDKYAYIFDRRNASDESEPKMIKQFCPDNLVNENGNHSANITCLVYSHDGKELLCSYNDDDIYLFDATHSSGSNYVKRFKGHRNNQTVKGVNFYGPRSEYVVSGSDCGNVFIWDKNSEKIVQCMKGDQMGVVNCLEPHPSAPILATSGLDSDVKVFMPCSPLPTDLSTLDEIVSSNMEEREKDREDQFGEDDNHLRVYYLTRLNQILRRQMRRRGSGDEGDVDDDSDHDSDDSDGDGDSQLPVRCDPS